MVSSGKRHIVLLSFRGFVEAPKPVCGPQEEQPSFHRGKRGPERGQGWPRDTGRTGSRPGVDLESFPYSQPSRVTWGGLWNETSLTFPSKSLVDECLQGVGVGET